MNSLERVQATLNHKPPDRVPIDLGFAPELWEQVKKELGYNNQQLSDWVDNDLVFVGPNFKNPVSEICYADPTIEVTREGHYLDIYRVPFRQVQTGLQTYVELAGRPPLQNFSSIQELEHIRGPARISGIIPV